jgi:hypothetical protein
MALEGLDGGRRLGAERAGHGTERPEASAAEPALQVADGVAVLARD